MVLLFGHADCAWAQLADLLSYSTGQGYEQPGDLWVHVLLDTTYSWLLTHLQASYKH
jgi:hypothetical protein